MTKQEIAKMIDHTLLSAFATSNEIEKLCDEAKIYEFCSVCVNPSFVPFSKKKLEGTNVRVCSVIGFPLGALPTKLKIEEAQWLIEQGVDEIDMVMNLGDFKDSNGRFLQIRDELIQIKKLLSNRILKVIIETCYLSDYEIRKATEIVQESGADFVKTSTGFGSGGATKEALTIMIDSAKGSSLKVKASGGVKALEQVQEYLAMGVERIGTSSGVSIIKKLGNSDR